MSLLRPARLRWIAGLLALSAFGQGVSSRGVKAQPRGKPSGIPFHARFTDIAAAAGLSEASVYGPVDHKNYILEVTGSGVAFFDYDNDGWLDILVLNGTRLEGAPAGTTNRLYKNNRDGTFKDVTASAGLVRTGWASSVTVGDYNNDGFEDIFITNYGQNVLYRNRGDGTFADVTRDSGLLTPGTRWGSGATWIDYDRDGQLDLFVADYLEFDPKTAQKAGENRNCNWKGVPVNCGPRGMTASSHRLFRNDGKGHFTDVSASSGVGKAAGSYAMTSVAADFNNDGWTDILVACDSTPSFLFINNQDGTFLEEGLERGAALSEDGVEQAGMGLAIGDFNLDGNPDFFKTHFADDTHGLFRNDGKGNFTDSTMRGGLGVETRYIGWGAGMFDFDNDGLPDIFAVTGSVYPEVEKKVPAYAYKTPRLLFRNIGGGKFEELIDEAGPGVSAIASSRGCAFGDFDNDGDVDVLIWNMNEPPSLLRNDVTGKQHWLKVQLVGTASNRSGIGARVTVHYGERVQAQERSAQSSYYSVNDHRLHFGLGSAAVADIIVRWPNGRVEKISKVPADQLIMLKEGQGIVGKGWK